jgi:hypothetical protein
LCTRYWPAWIGPFPPAGSSPACDFTSRPTRRKPITVAHGRLQHGVVRLERIDEHVAFDDFAQWLRDAGPWVAAIDMPFGLPRELVLALGWPTEWLPLMRHYAALARERDPRPLRRLLRCAAGRRKFAHRACDGRPARRRR